MEAKPKATIKIKNTDALPKSYIEYKPYVKTKKNEKIKTYGNKVERLV